MISLLHLSKLIQLITFFTLLFFGSTFAADPVDIWEKNKDENQEITSEKKITIENPTLSEDINKITIQIDENKIDDSRQSIVGIFDPEENDFDLNMWSNSNGEEIKKILKRIKKLKLSEFSEDLLYKVLFTNAYPPKTNLSSKDFLKIKINWLIKNERFDDLETLLINNPEVGKDAKTIKTLIDEYLSSANIKSACDKIKFMDKEVQNDYLEKFSVYCLIHEDRKNEAQLVYDLLKERGLKDSFFENKINFLLGITEKSNEKILDDNLLNFYLSHITNSNFVYEPNDNTDKYIWRYLSSANLIEIKNFENENIILTYEQAANENSFRKDEIFKIYLKMPFNFNQLISAQEIYKNLPSYKARALIYQSLLLSENAEKKIYLAFLLKDLFVKDKLLNVYSEELSSILKTIDPEDIPSNYVEQVEDNISKNKISANQIKFDNDILHRSKVIRHFLNDNKKISRTEKDFKTVYKKIKRNKKYFISIKDIIVLESLSKDGIDLPKDLDLNIISSELTIPQNLESIVNQKQTGLVMLKIIEIIGEDDIINLDPETLYFLNNILNKLNLKKIRNNILSEALPVRT
tara:strand:+ start:722 stop:2455 length:1734 start_codon:yes stop_codon:yes gene_type:complete